MSVDGHCGTEFDALRQVFEQNIESGEELGASIVVDVDGEVLVDLWGGFRDPGGTEPWTPTPSRTSGRRRRR